jgi:hypothetical protein
MKTRAVKLIFSVAIFFILGVVNFLFPVIRFSNEIANKIALILILSMPLLIIIISAWLPNPWVQIVLFFCLVPVVGSCLIIQLITGLYLHAEITNPGNPPLKSQRVVVNGSEIYWYDPGLMPGSSFGVIVQQERQVLPGILFVRKLYVEDPVKNFNSLEIAGHDSVRLVMRDSAKPDLIIPVRRFVWF